MKGYIALLQISCVFWNYTTICATIARLRALDNSLREIEENQTLRLEKGRRIDYVSIFHFTPQIFAFAKFFSIFSIFP